MPRACSAVLARCEQKLILGPAGRPIVPTCCKDMCPILLVTYYKDEVDWLIVGPKRSDTRPACLLLYQAATGRSRAFSTDGRLHRKSQSWFRMNAAGSDGWSFWLCTCPKAQDPRYTSLSQPITPSSLMSPAGKKNEPSPPVSPTAKTLSPSPWKSVLCLAWGQPQVLALSPT